jgi:type VI secretion system protein ImpM
MNESGFYGKLAGRGDFIHRGLPNSFIEPWDAWLSAGIAASQVELGAAWLDAYLVSPLWRFAASPGLLGREAVTGVMMPSIDRVGRYFPLCIAHLLEPEADLASLVGGPDDWFVAAEALLLSSLDTDADFDSFEAEVDALGAPHYRRQAPHSAGFAQRYFKVGTPAERTAALAQLGCEEASLWWGRGSERVAAGLLRCAGLPQPQAFSIFLLGEGGSARSPLPVQLDCENP